MATLNFDIIKLARNEAKVKVDGEIYIVGRAGKVQNNEYGYYKQRLEVDEYGKEIWVGDRWNGRVFAKNLAQALLEMFYDYRNLESADHQYYDPASYKELLDKIKVYLKQHKQAA